jgi:hypothetical protein
MTISFRQIPAEILQSFLDFCSESNIYKIPEHVKLPTSRGLPVQLIADPSDGFSCIASPDCEYAVEELAMMKGHCRKNRGATSLMNQPYRPCKVQKIFASMRKSCVEVGKGVFPGARPDVNATLRGAFLPAVDLALVVPFNPDLKSTL